MLTAKEIGADAGLTGPPDAPAVLLERPPTLTAVPAGLSEVVFWLQLTNSARPCGTSFAPGGAVRAAGLVVEVLEEGPGGPGRHR